MEASWKQTSDGRKMEGTKKGNSTVKSTVQVRVQFPHKYTEEKQNNLQKYNTSDTFY